MGNEDNIKKPLRGSLGNYFNDVEKYSEEHLKDINKLTRLLESLQMSQKSVSDTRAFAEIGELVRSLDKFLIQNKTILSDKENTEISAIIGSKLSPAASKRMIEDVIHKIKNRVRSEVTVIKEQLSLEREIDELRFSKFWILDWLRLVKFSLDYGTITLLSHQLKDSSFSIVRDNGFNLMTSLVDVIRPVLDRDYYYLSILEYNTLTLFPKIMEALEKLRKVPYETSYVFHAVKNMMDEFTSLYLALLKNFRFAEQGLKKIFSINKAPHGFWGMLYDFCGNPIYQNKPLTLSDYDCMTETITGTLLSFYTSSEGLPVRTINQVLYLTKCDCSIDSKRKNLTPAAEHLAEEKKNDENSKGRGILERFNEIKQIVDTFLVKGAALAEKFLKSDTRIPFNELLVEYEKKPMMKFKKLVDGFIALFIDPISNTGTFNLVYDGKEYPRYFEKKNEIPGITKHYTHLDLDIIGSKEKDFTDLTTPQDSTASQFIFSLTKLDINKSSLNPRVILAREILQKISNKSYQLALALNDLILHYSRQKEVVRSDVIENYDFFLNAIIKGLDPGRLKAIFNKREVSLSEFIEAACSMAFYLSQELNNSGIEAIIEEKKSLARDVERIESGELENRSRDIFNSENILLPDDDNGLLKEINEMYRDPLTGIWKYSYLMEQIYPRICGEDKKYRSDKNRYVFLCEIDQFSAFNTTWGHDVGDRLMVEMAKCVVKNLYHPGRDAYDIVARYDRGIIIGYLNNISMTSAVENLIKIRSDVNGIFFKTSDNREVSQVSLNAGIYVERRGTDYNNNIRVALGIMNYANRDEGNRIGFTKDQNRIVTEKDFNSRGDLDDEIVTIM